MTTLFIIGFINKKVLLLFFFVFLGFNSFAQQYKYYYGNLHAHTAYSDGNKDSPKSKVHDPLSSFNFARETKHLDFLGISEHNHSKAGMELVHYNMGLEQAIEANIEDSFVCMYGMEYGVISNGGHVLIYGMDSLIGWEDDNYDIFSAKSNYKSLWRILVNHPEAFATLAHPAEKDFSDLFNKPYNATADSAIYGVAVRTGPAFSKSKKYNDKPSGSFYNYYRNLLAKGYHVGPTIDHDNHNTTFGRNIQSRTVLLAPSLTKDDLFEAYKSMRFYASDDWNIKVDFTVNDEPMGSIIKTEDKAFIKISVEDDAVDKIASIKLLFGELGSKKLSAVLKTITAKKELEFEHSIPLNKTYYYHVEITQKDGDKIWTAPIWVTKIHN